MGIFEIHFHDSEFEPTANFGPAAGAADEDDEGVSGEESSFETDEATAGGSTVVPALVALAVLAGVAFAAKKLLN
ncbi:hypothetical protein [Salarchaeum sp. JOR-1]|uniref:hypothetical protein n=1 Tax=Salarchaeum sp. JOR-1 TaxID=2599399 RepID=UPI001198A5B8|nr:hypothetical protein [Salarchaeum sp. JOR-1]QDX41650.1 hypothetical protein FQU85_12320 [Salarchaeum sp. JOR-1]